MQSQHSQRLRRAPALVAVTALLLGAFVGAAGPAEARGQRSSDEVAAEILRKQEQADELAQRWAEASQRGEDLAIQLAAATTSLASTSATVDALEASLTEAAIDRYTGESSGELTVFIDDPSDEIQRAQMTKFIKGSADDELDRLQASRSDLEDESARVADLQRQSDQQVTQLERDQASLEQQLADLEVLRQQLEDAEVKQAYEAKVAERQARLAAEAQAQADAQAAAEAAATTTAPAKGGGDTRSTTSSTGGSGVQSAPPATPKPPPAAPKGPLIIAGAGFRCPIAGPNAFGDTWGAARSGGRHHEGVDMMSPEGTPIVAVVGGNVTFRTATLGGLVMSLVGNDGNRYFYGHLSRYEGSSRSVVAGEVIGYVGHTGNTTANHLHFEIHPGGGPAVNPYATVRSVC